jgi:limonene-1,2-epoxide hydrolase
MIVNDAKHAWLDDLLASIDEKNTSRFLRFLTDDAVFRFGSAAPVAGTESIRAAVDGFFSTIAGSKHVLDKILVEGGTLVCEGEVTYTRHDESTITLPFANIFEMEGDLISHYKIYADAGPLYET